jgi:nicotinamide-nucleotide amidase
VEQPAVELLCVGTELLDGKLNTHLAFLASRLRSGGLRLARETTLPDSRLVLAAAAREALARCDVLLVCGGLGPTFDDLTREALSDALDRELVFEPSLYAGIRRRFARLKLRLAPNNRRQAFLLRGARALPNATGSAPGQLLRLPRPGKPARLVALLPGPTGEMVPMFEKYVLPSAIRAYGRRSQTRSLTVRLCGLTESAADERLKSLTRRPGPDRDFTILFTDFGQVELHAHARAANAAAAQRAIAAVRGRIMRLVGPFVFGEGEETLEAAIGRRLRRRGLTVSVAESCTAGMLAARLTAAPGSSDYFRGGVLAYQDDLKRDLLGISPLTLRRYGAVSDRTAREMARGARQTAKASLGLAVTGLAGPRGEPGKPVGLVFIALSGPRRQCLVRRFMFSGDRETVRRRATAAALGMLWGRVK